MLRNVLIEQTLVLRFNTTDHKTAKVESRKGAVACCCEVRDTISSYRMSGLDARVQVQDAVEFYGEMDGKMEGKMVASAEVEALVVRLPC